MDRDAELATRFWKQLKSDRVVMLGLAESRTAIHSR